MRKLYFNDSYIQKFKADVIDVLKKDDKTILILDQTAFYPEGGGQPCDRGYIGDSAVSYVYEEHGIVFHVVDKEPSVHKNVECTIDWERRFDYMQQHCGQHILSAAFDRLLGGPTVGFHLGEEYVSVDIALDSLKSDDASKVEALSNEIVFKNLPIRYHYPEPEDISKYPLRKPPTVTKDIRIVEVDGFDFSPCCGTHPRLTGEVGPIKIIRWEKYKDGFRVQFLCGSRAIKDYNWKNEYINEISAMLSTKDRDVLENMKKVLTDLHRANKEVKLLKDKALSYEASELYKDSHEIKGIKVIKQTFEGRDFKEIISLGNKIANFKSAIVLLGLKSEKAQMIFTRSDDVNIKVNELFKEVLPLINGKGGGNPKSAQGGGTDLSNLESAIESAYIILKNRYL